MEDLKQYSLNELIERVIQERLIDSCECNDNHVVIVQGATRFVLNPVRAHAFLRGVIKGMSGRYRRRHASDAQEPKVDENQSTDFVRRERLQTGLVDSFRRQLLTKWWSRYEDANFPFGRSSTALMIWVRHNTNTTTN